MDEWHWKTSLRQTFRLLPKPSTNLRTFLEADGLTETQILDRMEYKSARAGDRGDGTGRPDRKRYRDTRQVLRSVGLFYEGRNGRATVTALGRATHWWLDKATEQNIAVLTRYSANALAAWQLRNPTPEGRGYPADVEVFPYDFIWKVMLGAEDRINTLELKCEVLRMRSDDEIPAAIDRILEYRRTRRAEAMRPPIPVDTDDRIIPWMSLASFGWALITDKKDSTDRYYRIRPEARRVVERAAATFNRHRDFPDEVAYLQHIERAAGVPEDLR